MLRYLFFIFIFSSCFNNHEQNTYDIFSPILLNHDSTKIYISDYIHNKRVDSVYCNLEYKYLKDKEEIVIFSHPNNPYLSILKLYVANQSYDILLRKSLKQKIVFKYKSDNKNSKKISLAGQFNDWNPINTQMKKLNDVWMIDLYLNPGNYQYQIVEDGIWKLDSSNNNIVSNGSGGFNSLKKVDFENGEKPSLSFNVNNNQIELISKNTDTIFVFYDNHFFSSENIFQIPKKIVKKEFSYIRVFSYNKIGESNSLLIPLKNGFVINDVDLLCKNDKYANRLYFMLVDRFSNGNIENDNPVIDVEVDAKANYYGGDLDGIINKIDQEYFTNLGINTIWLSPITQNPYYAETEYPYPHRKYSGYHGYWPISCTEIDTRFGDGKKLKLLVKKAHDKNIKVLLDFVSNHVHKNNPVIKQNPNWATNLILEDGRENIRIWDEQRLTTWFDRFLPTIDYSIPEAVNLMTDSALFMLKEYNLDGFRHDATKHIPSIFWRTLTKKIKHEMPEKKIYQIGETFGSRELIGSYVNNGQLDGQFDFNLYFDAREVFAIDSISFKKLNNSLYESFFYYGNHSLMGNITGNHDIPRFISFASEAIDFNEDAKEAGWKRNIKIKNVVGYDKLKMLTCFIMTIPGVPVIYYGDEIGMIGAGDPDNRRPMIFNNLNTYQLDVIQDVKKIIELRKSRISLIYGDFNLLNVNKSIYIYKRKFLDETTIVLFNKSKNEINIEINQNLNGFKSNFDSKITSNVITLKPYSFEILTN